MDYRNKYLLWFLGIETALYLVFLWLDFTNKHTSLSSGLKFLGIVLCFLWTCFRWRTNPKNQDTGVMAAALFFTVCADVCLLLSNRYLLGIFFFCLVQMLYLYRIQVFGTIHFLRRVVFRLAFFGAGLFLLFQLGLEPEPILAVTLFYFTNIAANVAGALVEYIRTGQKLHSWRWYVVGMVLFLLCDINVGIYNISAYVSIEGGGFEFLYRMAAISMWLFYLPGQVCIVLSSGKWKEWRNAVAVQE